MTAVSAYADYLEEILSLDTSDYMMPIPYELLVSLYHRPILAQIILNPFGPTLQTLSVASVGEEDAPSIMLRRSLNPHAEPEQLPVGVLYGDARDKNRQEIEVLTDFLGKNGVGNRPSSMPFVTAAPNAVIPGPRGRSAPDWFRDRYRSAVRHTSIGLNGATDLFRKHGANVWSIMNDEMHAAVSAISKQPEMRGSTRADGVRDAQEPLKPFREWWDFVTDDEVAKSAVGLFLMMWSGLAAPLDAEPEPEDLDMQGWLKMFLPWMAAWGSEPDE